MVVESEIDSSTVTITPKLNNRSGDKKSRTPKELEYELDDCKRQLLELKSQVFDLLASRKSSSRSNSGDSGNSEIEICALERPS